jgi:hypothetical protein
LKKIAERRMFAKTIVDSDAFIDMPISARLLYYDLGMRADDDGFVNSPKKIIRMISASDDDLKLLIAKKFIIPFENGVVVIKHWRIHNYIRKDTYKSTNYKEQLASLDFDENNAYTQALPMPTTVRDESVDEPSTQDRLGKDRIGKDIYGTFKNVKLTKDEVEKLNTEYGEPKANSMIEFLSSYREEKGYKNKSDYLSLRRWVAKAVDEKQDKPKQSTGNYLDEVIKEGMQSESNRYGKDYETDPVTVPRLLQRSR